MDRTGYKTLQEIADELQAPISKLRTIVARLGIQPTRFAGDLRKQFYSPEQIKQIKREIDFTSDRE